MPFDQEPTQSESLVPPRPNLGPEPWPTRQAWPPLFWWVGASVLLLVLIAGWRWRRRRPKRQPTRLDVPSESAPHEDSSPRQRLIASSEVVRGALIGAFGAGWGSKTTEEIAGQQVLADRLDPAEVERLVAFLKQADRAKFAEDESNSIDDWGAWAGSFVEVLSAGVNSRIKGK